VINTLFRRVLPFATKVNILIHFADGRLADDPNASGHVSYMSRGRVCRIQEAKKELKLS